MMAPAPAMSVPVPIIAVPAAGKIFFAEGTDFRFIFMYLIITEEGDSKEFHLLGHPPLKCHFFSQRLSFSMSLKYL